MEEFAKHVPFGKNLQLCKQLIRCLNVQPKLGGSPLCCALLLYALNVDSEPIHAQLPSLLSRSPNKIQAESLLLAAPNQQQPVLQTQ